MLKRHVNLIVITFFIAGFMVSCHTVDDVIRGIPGIADNVPRPIQIPASTAASAEAAKRFEQLIKGAGQRAKQAGKSAARDRLSVATGSERQISKESLWQVAYDTTLSELQRYNKRSATKFAEQELRDLAQQMTSDTITEVEQENQTRIQNGNGSPPQAQSNQSAATNAMIVGEPGSKNIRNGPGTNNGVMYSANPGDRVKILETGQDQGGYTWHRVYFPDSGAAGWIAAQLIQRD